MVTRRDVLAGLVAAGAPWGGLSWAATPQLLTATAARAQLAPEGFPDTPVWTFDGSIPGPELRLAQGSRLVRRVQNDLPVPTAVHWHGIRIANAMDGVPGLTQEAIASGASFDYDFVLPDAGTYWYHSHQHSMEQVERGLAGPLIVEEALPPETDRDIVLFLDDWKLDPESVELQSFDNGHDLSHAGRLGNLVTVNGQFNWTERAERDSRLRLRLINAANARVFDLQLKGVRGWIVALDGMPLERLRDIDGPLRLAPAQRMDLIVDVKPGADNLVDLITVEAQRSYSIARFEVDGGPRLVQPPPPFPLAPNPVPRLENHAGAPLTTLVMEGGAMRWLGQANMNGTLKDGRALAQEGKFWALSGVVGLPEEPVIDAKPGQVHRVALVNDTNFPHGMHLHGHHFHLIEADGRLGDLRDTVLVAPRETRQIAFVADNPGDWLLHCHMLGHAQAGMNTWFRVA